MSGRLLLCAGVIALAAGCREGRAEAAPRLAVGAPAPAAWASAPEEVLVGWAVTPEQLVTCETAAYQLRAWRARFGPALAISVVTVGSEPELVRAFLRAQRLSGVPVHMLSPREFRSTFGSPAEPMLFVVRKGRIRGRMSATSLPRRPRRCHVRLRGNHRRRVTPPLTACYGPTRQGRRAEQPLAVS